MPRDARSKRTVARGGARWRRGNEPSRETTRIEAFSDAVIAIMLTLLAVELLQFDVARARSAGLAVVLYTMWPSFLAFLLTFLVLGQVWVTHHNLWRYITRVDQGLSLLNLLLLLCIAVTPLAAQILADGFAELNPHDRALAAALYSATMLAQAFVFNLILWWARWQDLLMDDMGDELFGAIARRFLGGPAIYAAALGLAFVSPLLGIACYLGVVVLYLWPGAGDLPPGRARAPTLP
jgi:uncharacterized membrane protein